MKFLAFVLSFTIFSILQGEEQSVLIMNQGIPETVPVGEVRMKGGKFTIPDGSRDEKAEDFLIENKFASYVLNPGGGMLRLVSGYDKKNSTEMLMDSAYFHVGNHDSKLSLTGIKTEIVEGSNLSGSHKKMVLDYESDQLNKRIVLRLFNNSPVLAVDAYYKLKDNSIDNVDDWRLFYAHFQGLHNKYNVVSFFDQTDRNNNLMVEQQWLGFKSRKAFQGNLIFVNNLEDNSSFFLLKESPYQESQVNYLGYDFEVWRHKMTARGVGFSVEDLNDNKWTRSYSVAFSLYQGEFDRLEKLRSYQKCIRNPNKERGEMLMMNTWGDRNKDASIGEEFIKNEILACKKLGITHFQIDDGWQQGLSRNSASSGNKWEFWQQEDWQPNNLRFPNGFQKVVSFANKHGVSLGLWFAPSSYKHYQRWSEDAEVLINLYKEYGIKYFKIDGISIPTKQAEENLRAFFAKVLAGTNQEVFFNLDATAGIRGGYHFLYEYGGNIFLENRYTEHKYFPYYTLRNLWMLSKYVPAEQLQIEFLNKWRNKDKYGKDDPFAPQVIPFDYQFAIAMVAQPLAWFEGSNLPEEACKISGLINDYKKVKADFHSGVILPIGDEPNGRSWTGFQSVLNDKEGYFVIYREYNDKPRQRMSTYLNANSRIELVPVLKGGGKLEAQVNSEGLVEFSIEDRHGFSMYKYQVKD